MLVCVSAGFSTVLNKIDFQEPDTEMFFTNEIFVNFDRYFVVYILFFIKRKEVELTETRKGGRREGLKFYFVNALLLS